MQKYFREAAALRAHEQAQDIRPEMREAEVRGLEEASSARH